MKISKLILSSIIVLIIMILSACSSNKVGDATQYQMSDYDLSDGGYDLSDGEYDLSEEVDLCDPSSPDYDSESCDANTMPTAPPKNPCDGVVCPDACYGGYIAKYYCKVYKENNVDTPKCVSDGTVVKICTAPTGQTGFKCNGDITMFPYTCIEVNGVATCGYGGSNYTDCDANKYCDGNSLCGQLCKDNGQGGFCIKGGKCMACKKDEVCTTNSYGSYCKRK